MAKRKLSTGLKANNKTIYVGDVLKFKVTDNTTAAFHDNPLGNVFSKLDYDTLYVTVDKHKWLELKMTAFIMGQNDRLAEQGLVAHVFGGGDEDTFDKEYTEVAPTIFAEDLFDTTFLRFLLDPNVGLDVEITNEFQDILKSSEEFYLQAAQEIYMINLQKEEENGSNE